MSFLDWLFSHAGKETRTTKKDQNEISNYQFNYNKEGYYIHSLNPNSNYKVTVIMPVYNAEATMKKTIDSVVNQTIGFENIQLIIVDDQSTDSSRNIILEYAEMYKNIVPVFLKNNTGSPAIPRNIGIELAAGKYITFIDSDDWFNKSGLEILYETLERTGDNYAIGKTIQVTDTSMNIVGEYNNCETRDHIDPYSIPHLFQHLGPTARMMKTSFIKENKFKFPNMKFAEDKQFFIDVLTNCSSISTSKEVIYYANRLKDNKSLTTTTSIFEKTDTNIKVIKYVIEKQLPEKVEKMVLNRLYEFDCITRLFNRNHFLKSNNKEEYFKKFSEVLNTTNELRYNFTQNFFEPWHKVLVDLFREGRFDDIVTLIDWSLKDHTKETIIKNGLPYYRLPFNDKYQFARINMLAYHTTSLKEKEHLVLRFNIYGDEINQINSFAIRQRDNELNEIELPIRHLQDHAYETKIPYGQLVELSSSSYATFIKYAVYKKLFIKMDARRIINYDDKKIDFYTTVGDNFAISIK
ncbi:glycosyltransferase family 2 protein [Bacillus norwichensis]|uniref:Glycosyltransferase family 2 protein n=1 Tax=Bacillus norwichensis TaxID=2762217 RepID=A0ABR8VIP2_9BACI|nr:glycosyltransferase family 2 protein [Bacillus norwichensis]MBD8004281.1 glycosyltransferase family 2 protein [Bacillus norwichensis]